MATRKPTSTTPCRLRLVREGLEFEAEGDRDFVLEMIKQFVGAAPSPSGAAAAAAPIGRDTSSGKGSIPIKSSDKVMSVREFILQLESRKHTDLALAFGYYLEKHSGQPAFAPADISNLYYEAKLDTSNTSQMIIQNIKRGYMMEAKRAENSGKRLYVLTNSGEKYIEGLLTASQS